MKYLLGVTLLSWVLLFFVGKAAWWDGYRHQGSWIAKAPACYLLISSFLLASVYLFLALWLHRLV